MLLRYIAIWMFYCLVVFAVTCQDEKFLDSVRISERIKLWDKFAGSVDTHAVKLEFLKKIHRANPPFRMKAKCQKRLTMTVCFAQFNPFAASVFMPDYSVSVVDYLPSFRGFYSDSI